MKNPEQFLSELESAGLLRVLRDVECLPGGMARLADGREVVTIIWGWPTIRPWRRLFPVRCGMKGPGLWRPAW